MPIWGNTDVANQKPKFPRERQTREIVQAVTANSTASGANTIVFTANVQALGVAAGQYVYAANVSANGTAGFFASNNTVATVSGNTITLSAVTFGTLASGATVGFDTAIVFNTNKTASANYNSDTILATTTRAVNAASGSANSAYALGNVNVGWNRIIKKVNNDGTTRYLKETLVALASPTAANTNSGNTSWGQALTGL